MHDLPSKDETNVRFEMSDWLGSVDENWMCDGIEVIPCEQRKDLRFSREGASANASSECEIGVRRVEWLWLSAISQFQVLSVPFAPSSEVSSRVCKLQITQDHNVFLCVCVSLETHTPL